MDKTTGIDKQPLNENIAEIEAPPPSTLETESSTKMDREISAPRTRLDTFKKWIEIIQAALTILAFFAAFWWFYKQESTSPQVKLEQTVTQRPLDGSSNTILITIDVHATNVGKVKVELTDGQMDLLQINPTPSSIGQARLVSFPFKRLTLEPGESDQALFKAINVYNSIKTVQVHSIYKVPKSSEVGWNPLRIFESNSDDLYWNLLSVADLGADAEKRNTATSVH
jgi:hypothetical protein